MSEPTSRLQRWSRQPLAPFLVATALVFALNWQVLSQPPVWDSAAGLFPAALYLEANGFDLFELVRQPDYLSGGPNVHPATLVTFTTALAYRLSSSPESAFIALHILHFLLAAFSLASLFDLARDCVGEVNALLLTLGVALFPLFLTQSRYMYLEIPLVLCTLRAVHCWVSGQSGRAALWAFLAALTKESGVLVAGALAVAAMLERGSPSKRAGRVAAFLLPALLFSAYQLLFLIPEEISQTGPGGAPEGLARVGHIYRQILACASMELRHFHRMVPDLFALFLASGAIIALGARDFFHTLREEIPRPGGQRPGGQRPGGQRSGSQIPVEQDPGHSHPGAGSAVRDPSDARAQRVLALSALLVPAYLGFHSVLMPGLDMQCNTLPRYNVQVLPFLVLLSAHRTQRMLGPRVTSGLLVLAVAFFVVNRDGALYPSDVGADGDGFNFAIAERSGAYRHALSIEREAVALLDRVPARVPVLYEHHFHYLVQNPRLGYIDSPLENGRNLYTDTRYQRGILTRYPSCFVLFGHSPWRGGDTGRKISGQADRAQSWHLEVLQRLESGPYHAKVYKIWQEPGPCLVGFEPERDASDGAP